MKLLALESATEQCSVALWHGGTLSCIQGPAHRDHSETLLPMVQRLLSEAGVDQSQLDAIAFGMGPGAFTGLRMACGVAQGMALGLGIPVVPISTLLALAEGSGHERVITALDARMNQLYVAAYESVSGQWITRIAPCLCDSDQLPQLPEGIWLPVGSGAEMCRIALIQAWPGQLLPVKAGLIPQAIHVATLGVAAFQSGLAVPPEQAVPLYLRDKVALTRMERAAK
ncbi:MAG: tRNA (adenosine(37)-N6)-threonylcarbamoyltransferase complex dimerization subunit type 1 TsaB [Burkholderiales bacterium]|nr:tRNA (adenosine(37)-N6)-threonylcarbamoyltransferase complex dimerization subunit type 1 TsaB [Ferrovum sp.]